MTAILIILITLTVLSLVMMGLMTYWFVENRRLLLASKKDDEDDNEDRRSLQRYLNPPQQSRYEPSQERQYFTQPRVTYDNRVRLPSNRRSLDDEFDIPTEPYRWRWYRLGWFLMGFVVGVGGFLALPYMTTESLKLANTWFVSLIDPKAQTPIDLKTPSETPPVGKDDERLDENVISSLPAVAEKPIGKLSAAFVDAIKEKLPMRIGIETEMLTVDQVADTISLGYVILRPVPDDEIPSLQTELGEKVRQSVCKEETTPKTMRGLSQRGVTFLINYVDLNGKSVVTIDLPPNVC